MIDARLMQLADMLHTWRAESRADLVVISSAEDSENGYTITVTERDGTFHTTVGVRDDRDDR